MSAQTIPHPVVPGNATYKPGLLFVDKQDIDFPNPCPDSDGQGHNDGRLPTAVGTPDLEDHCCDPAARATYLLEYGCDVVARVSAVAPQVACHLDAQLAMLHSNFQAVLARQDALLLDLLIDHLDVVLAPGELLLVEVEL